MFIEFSEEMKSYNKQSSFWQFSDDLRHQKNDLSKLSFNDSIWNFNYSAKRSAEDHRNFDVRSGGDLGAASSPLGLVGDVESDLDVFNLGISNGAWTAPINNNSISGFRFSNDEWKTWKSPINDNTSGLGFSSGGWKSLVNDNVSGFGSGTGLNGGFNKGIYTSPLNLYSYNRGKGFMNINNCAGGKNEDEFGHDGGKNGKKKNNKGNKENSGESKNAADKKFKNLPPSESLSRNETIGGYIFVCNNDPMTENLKRQLFVFQAATFGGTNIDPSAWEDKKNPGESRFPAQICHQQNLLQDLEKNAALKID